MTLTLGREAFLNAERSAHERRRAEARAARRELDRCVAAAEAGVRAARAPACPADHEEVAAALEAAHELAELTDSFALGTEAVLERLARANPALVEPDPRFLGVLADAVGDRLADRDLASLYRSAVRRLETDR